MSKGDTVRFDVSMIAEDLPLKIGERKGFDVAEYKDIIVKSYSGLISWSYILRD
jgi:hypothetical protein